MTKVLVEPDSKGGLAESLSAEVREVERKVLARTDSAPRTLHERLRRIAFFFRRLVG
jgi:hypothetical protein